MLLFVVDVSPELGFGHLTRCLNLARLNRHDSEILFVFKHDKGGAQICRQNRFQFSNDMNSLDWSKMPVTAIFDICRIIPEYLTLIEKIEQNGGAILQITDLGLNLLPVPTVIDGSLLQYNATAEQFFSGPDYMILHHKVRHFHKLNRYFRTQVRNIMISLGGGVKYREMRRVVDVLKRHGYSCKIASGFTIKKNQKKTLSRLYPGISWVGQTESLARAYYQSDVALIAPGVSAYEAAATGTPALYLSHHEEQEKTAFLFEREGAGLRLGLLSCVDMAGIPENLKKLSRERRTAMGISGKSLVDGLGLYRVNKILNAAVIYGKDNHPGGTG